MELPGSGQADALLGRAQAAGEQARLRSLGQERAPHTREDLARTAREFEGVFLDILMKAMRSTVPQNDLMGSGGATQIYRQMHDTEMARALAGTGDGLGIARLLEAQFAEQFAEDEAAADTTALGPEAPAASTASRVSGALPSPLALARYRQGSAPSPTPALRVVDLGEFPVQPAAGVPVAMPAATPTAEPAPPAATPAAGRDLPDDDAGPDGRSPRRALLPTDLRLDAAPLLAAEADTVRRFGPLIDRAASASGLDPRLVLAVVMEESGGDPEARSRAGARGLMQLMPGTARDLGVRDAHDPAANVGGGSRYLAEQLERFDGRLDLALAAYNAGPGNVEKAGNRVPAFAETRNYVRRVMDRYERLRTGTELDTGGR